MQCLNDLYHDCTEQENIFQLFSFCMSRIRVCTECTCVSFAYLAKGLKNLVHWDTSSYGQYFIFYLDFGVFIIAMSGKNILSDSNLVLSVCRTKFLREQTVTFLQCRHILIVPFDMLLFRKPENQVVFFFYVSGWGSVKSQSLVLLLLPLTPILFSRTGL